MHSKVFVDTNVLLRATVAQFPNHADVKKFVDTIITADTELWISRQIIREYVTQTTRPQNFMKPMTVQQVYAQYILIRAVFKIADDTETVTDELMALLHKYAVGGK